MSDKTKIQWCDSTWNPWVGCSKVSAGCVNCYAEHSMPARMHCVKWGAGAPRRRASEATLREPFKWNKKPWICEVCGKAFGRITVHECTDKIPDPVKAVELFHHRRVFSLSLGDWLDPEVPVEWLAEMLDTIRLCGNLTWILVTKRPEKFRERLDAAGKFFYDIGWEQDPFVELWLNGTPPPNVWVMASVEDQKAADERIPHLLRIPAAVHGLSIEPLFGPIEMGAVPGGMKSPIWHDQRLKIDWLVIGGESGPRARPCNVEWIRSLVDQGRTAGCPVFVKQLGTNSVEDAGLSDGFIRFTGLNHPKGGDPSEWPEDLRVRQWPDV